MNHSFLAFLIATLTAAIAQEVTPKVTVIDGEVTNNPGTVAEVRVTLKDGEVVGFADTFETRELDVFLGVPYVQPPLDQLRFKKPLPLQPWTTPIEAKKLSAACHQVLSHSPVPQSEDCLYLNVWAPKSADVNPKPVLVWIHGGGLVLGSASQDWYEGKVLAARGDVVVVSFNYRLNTFGFLHLGSDEAPGNVGLYDQALALEWISDNIAQFGGNPNQMTLFGESAGAWSVGLHLLSPLTRNLFNNAVMLSGAPTMHLFTNKHNVLRYSLAIAKLANCSDGRRATKDTIDCMRKVPAEKLATISLSPDVSVEALGYVMYPLVLYGDQFLPLKPVDMLQNGDFRRDGSLLFGTAEDEGAMFLVGNGVERWLESPPKVTKQETIEQFKRLFTRATFNPELNVDDVVSYYFEDQAEDDGFALSRALSDTIGDYYLKCPALQFAREMFEGSLRAPGGKKKRVYQYLWSYKSRSKGFQDMLGPLCTPQMGACHASELFALFGRPFSHPDFDEDDKMISQQLMDTVISFAKIGKPPRHNNIDWPKYKSIQSQTIRVHYNFDRAPNAGLNKHLDDTSCQVLWNRYLNN